MKRDVELLEAGVLLVLGAMALLWAAVSNAQPSSLNGQPLTAVLCDGGVVCSRRGSVATIIVTATSGGGGGGSSDFDGGVNVIEDEGVPLTKRTTLNMTGAGVACSDSGGKTVCTISGGGAGSSNFVEVDVSFGSGDELVTTVVTGQTWVTASSRIVCSPTMLATATRLEAEEDAVAEGLVVAAHSRVAGVGFSLTVAPRIGASYGTFKIHCTGD
jgi:hypothetical protein